MILDARWYKCKQQSVTWNWQDIDKFTASYKLNQGGFLTVFKYIPQEELIFAVGIFSHTVSCVKSYVRPYLVS